MMGPAGQPMEQIPRYDGLLYPGTLNEIIVCSKCFSLTWQIRFHRFSLS